MAEKNEINDTYRCWEDLRINNDMLRALGWLLEGNDYDRVPCQNFLGYGIGRIVELFLQEQERIIAEYAPTLKAEMAEEAPGEDVDAKAGTG